MLLLSFEVPNSVRPCPVHHSASKVGHLVLSTPLCADLGSFFEPDEQYSKRGLAIPGATGVDLYVGAWAVGRGVVRPKWILGI